MIIISPGIIRVIFSNIVNNLITPSSQINPVTLFDIELILLHVTSGISGINLRCFKCRNYYSIHVVFILSILKRNNENDTL